MIRILITLAALALSASDALADMVLSDAEKEAIKEYVDVRDSMWRSIIAGAKKSETIKPSSELATNMCLIRTKEGGIDSLASICNEAKQYKDWMWFEVPTGGSMYCGSRYAMTPFMDGYLSIGTNGCTEDVSLYLFKHGQTKGIDLDPSTLSIDGRTYEFEWTSYENTWYEAFSNARRIALYSKVEGKEYLDTLSGDGSSAALRFLQLYNGPKPASKKPSP